MRQRRHWCVACLLLVAVCAPALAEEKAPDEAAAKGKVKIDKLYFLIHPVCWGMGMQGDKPPALPEGYRVEDYLAAFNRETRVNQLQKDQMSAMKPNEALVIYPISEHPLMKDLENHGRKVLGDRCIILRRNSKDPPPDWAKLDQPVKRFIDDKQLPGRDTFLAGVPEPIQAELEQEIREAGELRGYDWQPGVLEVVYTSRLWAMDIQDEFDRRGLYLDPKTTRAEAFGEGFEECAMTWKAMVVPYLGLHSPAANNWDLSVGGAIFLKRLRERIDLPNQITLFIWEGEDNSHYALFARAWCRLKDPQYHVSVPAEGLDLELWTQIRYGTKIWPAEGSRFKIEDGKLEAPVFNSIRRDSEDQAVYIKVKGVRFETFRKRLLEALIRAR